MSESYANVHGRKGGRGLRPWLLIPKVLAVAGFLGSLASALACVMLMETNTLDQWRAMVDAVESIIEKVMVPCAFATVGFGVALLALHWRALIRQRWMRVKAVLMAIGLPACHFWARGVFEFIEEQVERGGSPEGPTGALECFQMALATGIVLLITLIWLGRHKPRLGQKVKPSRRPG